jgi:hypothetical protein
LIALMRRPPRDTRRLVHAIFIVNSTVDNEHAALLTKHEAKQRPCCSDFVMRNREVNGDSENASILRTIK